MKAPAKGRSDAGDALTPVAPSRRLGERPSGVGSVAVGLAGVALVVLLAVRIDAPWTYIHDDNGAWTQAVATAHLRAGLAHTRGQDFMLRRSDGTLVPYLHHPPLYPLTMAAAYAIAGTSDPWLTRLLPAAFHVLGFLGLVVLAGWAFPTSPARRAVAAWTYALVPMSSFFGKNPFNEPQGLCLVVWACVFLTRWLQGRGWPWIAASSLCWAAAGGTSWPAYPLLACQVVWLALEAGLPRSRMAARVLAATGAVSFVIVAVQLAWAGGGSLAALGGAGGHWRTPLHDPTALLHQLGSALDMHRRYFANVPFILFLAWCAVPSLRSRDWRGRWPERLVVAGAVGSLLWALSFLPQVALHGYGQFWFLPFEAMAAADVAITGWERLARRPSVRLLLAALALAGASMSSAYVLVYRYTHPHGYAIEAAARIQAAFETRP